MSQSLSSEVEPYSDTGQVPLVQSPESSGQEREAGEAARYRWGVIKAKRKKAQMDKAGND